MSRGEFQFLFLILLAARGASAGRFTRVLGHDDGVHREHRAHGFDGVPQRPVLDEEDVVDVCVSTEVGV